MGRRNVMSPAAAAKAVGAVLTGGKLENEHKPAVYIPGGSHTITSAAIDLGRLLGKSGKYFLRGNCVVRVVLGEDRKPTVAVVKPAALTSAIEGVATICKSRLVKGEWVDEPAIFPEQLAKQVLESDDFRESLPVLRVLCRCPVLIERGTSLVEIVGYDRKSGIYASGRKTTRVSLDKARELLDSVLREFHFASMADRSRALAAIITPALVFSGLLKGRAPLDLGEADQSQTGKGYRNKLVAAIYDQGVKTITQRKGGVGSMEESISTALIRGSNFICIDNLKGKLDSPALESLLTETTFEARGLRISEDIDVSRTVFQLTSNKADFTPDLASRASCVRLLKRA